VLSLPTRLDDEGYDTAYVGGKYLNDWREKRYVPPGWDRWVANSKSDVWSRCLAENGRERCYESKNMDVVLSRKAEGYVSGRTNPFFLWMSTNAPHQKDNGPPPYPESERSKFGEKELPRPPSFNEEDVSVKPPWIRDNPLLGSRAVGAMTREHRARLRSLQVVNAAVRRMLAAL
jgi:N-acetylglucosamine-6-sulfatase